MPDNIFGIEDASISGDYQRANEDLLGSSFDAADVAPIIQKEQKPQPKAPVVVKQVAIEEEEEDEKETFDPTVFLGKVDNEEESSKEDAEKEEEDEDEDEEGETTPETNSYEDLSKDLYEAGIFKAGVDEEGNEVPVVAKTAEELKKLFETQSYAKAQSWLDNLLSRFGDDHKEAFEAIYLNGVSPHDYFSTQMSIDNLANLDIHDNEANQKKVIREFYKRSGLTDDGKIEKRIQRLVDNAELEEEALDLHPQLVDQDKQRLAELEEQSKQRIELERRADLEYKSSIFKILTDKIKTKDFDGIPVNEKTANEAFDFLYSKKWKLPDGRVLTDFDIYINNLNKPENHAAKVKFALLAKNNLDLSKVKTTAISKETSTLFKSIAKQQPPKQKNTAPKSTFGANL